MAKSMSEWVTTLRRELENPPTVEEVKEVYIQSFQEVLGVRLVVDEPSELEWKIFMEETKPRHTSREWLYIEAPITRKNGRSVKIAHDVKVVEVEYKAGKLIRVRAEIKGDMIVNVQIRGDFFMIPGEALTVLEDILKGVRLEDEELMKAICGFYVTTDVMILGITGEDFKNALMRVKEHL